jgi:hypothetical protein
MQKHRPSFLIFAAVIVGGSALILLLVIAANSMDARQQQYTGNENHVITLDQAVKYVQNFTNNPTVPNIKDAYFGRNIFDKILAQPGCVGVRYYYGKKDDGSAAVILVGVDSGGNDLTQGILGDDAKPCPPWCPVASPLNRQ